MKWLVLIFCAVFDHPAGASDDELRRYRKLIREATLAQELRGNRLQVTISCLCGRRMVPIDPWEDE